MRGRFPPDIGSLHVVISLLLLALVACSSPAPSPTPSPPATVLINTPLPSATATITGTWTSVPTETATSTATPTVTNTPSPSPTTSRPPAGSSKGSVVDNNLWFMSQLINYFSQVGPYPSSPPISRAADINPLTGLAVPDPALLQRRVILARVMNDPKARPQTGLNEADLVFEELIDQRNGFAALTRFTAVYLGIPEATIRPMRSVRLINPSLTDMFGGALVHSGASKGMNFLLSKIPITSIGQDFNPGAYCAIGDPVKTLTWATTTVSHLHDYLKSKGLERSVPLRGFDFTSTSAGGAPAASIGFDHPPFPVSTVGAVLWKYDPTSGTYLRFANGTPHNSLQYGITGRWGGACQETGDPVVSQVHAANVVLINALHHPTDPNDFTEDTNKFTNIFIELTGSGSATVFRDGIEINGTWKRPSLEDFIQFEDAGGNAISLKPGNTWFEIVPPGYLPTIR